MGVRIFKPLTAGTRHRIDNTFEEITTNKPEKSLLEANKSSGGRNNQGRRSIRYHGGGHKQQYRIIDFKRNKHDIPATVASIEYDPNRTAFIALLHYADGEKRYIISPRGLKVGQKIISGSKAAPETGNALMLRDIPLGTFIHCVELQPGNGASIARGAGTSVQLTSKEESFAVLRMPSGEVRKVLLDCMATIGQTSNPDHNLEQMGKAGRNRWRGIKPRNRGVAMNPVDHPMGGGEGKASGGQPRSRNGQKSRGLKTRTPKKQSNKFIVSRRKK